MTTQPTTQPVADFSLPGTSGLVFRLHDAPTKKLVLYFYPKDSTPGCTLEGQAFGELYEQFRAADCEIYGISRDSLKSHERFKANMGFPFELLSDTEEVACKLFDVIKMKTMYGKQVRGIQRSTFVLDAQRAIEREWRGVKVPGHAQEVLDFVKTR